MMKETDASINYPSAEGGPQMQPTRPFWGKQGSTVSMLLVKPTQVATQGVGIVLYGPEKDLSQPRYAGWAESGTMVWKASWLNLLFIVIPFAWASHWLVDTWGHEVTFLLCFISIIPLQNIFDWCGDQVARRKETEAQRDLGDFLAITFKNLVEATLSAILLKNCHLRLLQSTVAGVVILHLLLVPGTAFFVGGSQTFQQILHPHHASLNPSLLMTGVLAIMLPTAFFAALDRGASADGSRDTFVSDSMRDSLLKMSRGISVMLLLIYIASRIYRHFQWPPRCLRRDVARRPCSPADGISDATAARPRPHSYDTEESDPGEQELAAEHANEKLLHPIVCAILICVSTAVMAVTAEFLVQSIDPIRERFNIQAEWFGLILLPLLGRNDASAKKPRPTSLLAHGRPIDLSIQFTLWWMPLLVLFAWWTGKPFHLLFDYFEVALLLGSCFLVNYVTADGKTNFAEGVTLITFYAMIATATWFYPGQPQVGFLLSCPGSVAEAVASDVGNALAVSL
ncbi:hypothetical protein VTO73DRAFT_6292 [Trametes versicolor]